MNQGAHALWERADAHAQYQLVTQYGPSDV